MFLASNICCVSSGTVTARYCWLPRAVNGAKPVMKKWRRGNGTNRALVLSFHDLWRQLTQVDRELAQVRVELTREAQAGGDAGHDDGDKVVEVSVARARELEDAEADLVERLVVNAERLVAVLDELVHGKRGVIGLIETER